MNPLGTIAALALLAAAPAVNAETRWSVNDERGGRPGNHWEVVTGRNGRLDFEMTSREAKGRNVWRTDLDDPDLPGFDRRWLSGASKPVRFSVTHEAGQVVFTGEAGRGRAAGTFEWIPDPGFRNALERELGVRSDDRTLLHLWQCEVGLEEVREIGRLVEGETRIGHVSDIAIHGGRAPRLRALREAGLAPGEARHLVELLIHGVQPDDVAALRALRGVAPRAAELVPLRIHGMPASELRALAGLGYSGMPAGELVKLRIHDVKSSYVREMHGLGYRDLTADQLVALRIHDVHPRFVRQVLAMAETRPSVQRLIDLRIRGFGD